MYAALNDLVQGDKIKGIKSFSDFDSQSIPVGSEWTFKEYSYFPYGGGYTFSFEEGEMRMAEISMGEYYYIYNHANEYFFSKRRS